MIALIVIILVMASFGAIYYIYGNRPSSGSTVETNQVILRTSMGDITIQLFTNMPITTNNFKNLVRDGAYDNTIFHRVVKGFVVQGGDVSGKGITVPAINDELPTQHSNVRGSVAMAKTSIGGEIQPDSATSQFFINLNDTNAANLDSQFSVFGTVIAGMDVVDAIGNVATDSNDKPLTNVTLIKAEFTT
jgi:peptidylprolyl isomerase